MGFISDDSDSDAERNPEFISDEESQALNACTPSFSHGAKENGHHSNRDLRTPTTKDNDILSVTKRLRRKGLTIEADEIWNELEDEDPSVLSSPMFHRNSRRFSTISTPTTRLRPSSALSLSRGDERDDIAGEAPNESTALLPRRSSTGRTYRDRRRRSMPFAGSERTDIGSSSTATQDALGGWWKMKWWKSKNGDDGGDEDAGERQGANKANTDRSA